MTRNAKSEPRLAQADLPATRDPEPGSATTALEPATSARVERSFDADCPRERLDRAVVWALEREGFVVSRATAQRWVEEGRVAVDGVVRTTSSWAPRDARRVVISRAPSPASHAEPDPSVVLSIVFEDDSLLVVDKPAGLVVHPARGHASGTLVNGLLAHQTFRAELAGQDSPSDVVQRPGIVHRLDRGTSGLLVVAKTVHAREHLKAQFAAHSIDREYVALVAGRATDCTIDSLHGRHPSDRIRFTSLGTPAGARRAVTHVRVLEQHEGSSLVACRLETGRTHQIRVHLSERMGTPILGDPLYGSAPTDPDIARIGVKLGHQALHARLLGLEHPRTRTRMQWVSNTPADFDAALAELRLVGATSRAESRAKLSPARRGTARR